MPSRETLIQRIGSFGEALDGATLSAPVIEALKVATLDSLGVILAGSSQPISRLVIEAFAGASGGPAATILCQPAGSTTMMVAALANGTMAHACDYDDASFSMWGHATAPVLPAALAVAETRDLPGRDFLAALALGLEVEKTLGLAIQPEHYTLGWHPTGTLGVFGAATGAAKALGLDREGIAAALGIAASRAAGIRANVGTMIKPLHAGFASRDGVEAALLASAGVRPNPKALEGADGFFQTHAPRHGDLESVTDRLGDPFEVLSPGLVYKLYPCCSDLHASIEAMLALRTEHRFGPEDVRRIRCGVTPIAANNAPYHDPRTPLEAKFSQEYVLAATLVRGHLGPDEFTTAAIQDPAIRAAVSRVDVFLAPELSGEDSVSFAAPAIVSVETMDGRVLQREVRQMRGHPGNPLSATDLTEKFVACATAVLGVARSHAVKALVMRLDTLPSIRELVTALASP